jgi:protein-S-isoprenylcysteine O-methyltransferase Ste14
MANDPARGHWLRRMLIAAIAGALIAKWLVRGAPASPGHGWGEFLARADAAGYTPAMLLSLVLWLGLGIYWEIAAFGAGATRSSEPRASRLFHLTLVSIGQALILIPIPGPLRARFLPDALPLVVAGLAIEAASVALSIWARQALGRNWSGAVSSKVDHELVRGGPYRLVRHPIYSGMYALSLGTALAVGEVRTLVGIAFLVAAFWRKIRQEERLLEALFGPAWDDYRRTARAVIPWLL